jgi:hypothetical protein
MENQMMCFVVIYHNNHFILQGMRNDDGESSYQYAKEKGYSVRKWEMYGMTSFSELDEGTKKEIKSFIKALS